MSDYTYVKLAATLLDHGVELRPKDIKRLAKLGIVVEEEHSRSHTVATNSCKCNRTLIPPDFDTRKNNGNTSTSYLRLVYL